ncbi:hypothetical protein [Rhodopirellula sp. MGV]|uniref:hypothetical protein n=1 Tax=Rhodopirellula sp. MGV TaxID=2023130 RepID=UPI000B9779AF|nr:hypothetical protein [Rhodopirellula sp. MGV]OYP38908.1 hypothetical protein CGZ80_01425 [Rhodopirellula sp. MGV]PNY38278.1 hypothetical protein C2E31_02910 [Rhodopirellula baltica]
MSQLSPVERCIRQTLAGTLRDTFDFIDRFGEFEAQAIALLTDLNKTSPSDDQVSDAFIHQMHRIKHSIAKAVMMAKTFEDETASEIRELLFEINDDINFPIAVSGAIVAASDGDHKDARDICTKSINSVDRESLARIKRLSARCRDSGTDTDQVSDEELGSLLGMPLMDFTRLSDEDFWAWWQEYREDDGCQPDATSSDDVRALIDRNNAESELSRIAASLKHDEGLNRPAIRRRLRGDSMAQLIAFAGSAVAEDDGYPSDTTITRWINKRK